MNLFLEHTNLLAARRALIGSSAVLLLFSNFSIEVQTINVFGINLKVLNGAFFDYLHLIVYYFLAVFIFRAYEKFHVINEDHNTAVREWGNVSSDFDERFFEQPSSPGQEKENQSLTVGLRNVTHRKSVTRNLIISFVFIEVLPAIALLSFSLWLYYK